MDLRAKLGKFLETRAPLERSYERAHFEATRAERIAKLRALIAEVNARHARPDQPTPTGRIDAPHPYNLDERAHARGSRARPLGRDARDLVARGSRPLGLRAEELAPLRRLGAREPAPPPWACMPTQHGPLHYVERWLEPDHHHGRAPVRDGLRSASSTLALLTRDAGVAGLDMSGALFLDTETTGLSGGTGTVAFLVGLARFEDGVLCVEQLLVPELGREAPVLARLAERLAAASCVVTYNGKSFDWPLLRNRYVLTRMPVPPLPAHIDLLHATRRIWKGRLDALRLTDIERQILHFERAHDIAGEEIPARYFEFLRGGEAERLAPILEHNQNDVIALAALLGALITRFEPLEDLADAGDALAFGRLALRMRDAARAGACARAALAASAGDRALRDALLFASEVARCSGDTAGAIERLEQALALRPEPSLKAAIHCTLAKLYEHGRGDLAGALRHARQTEACEGSVAHGRRLGRLHRRLLRGAA